MKSTQDRHLDQSPGEMLMAFTLSVSNNKKMNINETVKTAINRTDFDEPNG